LPLEKFCEEVDRQITAVGERAKLIAFDIADGPSTHIPAQRSLSYRTFSMSTSYEESPVASEDDDIESGRELSETDRLVPKLKILLF